ncbi:MAG: TonB-dependent receptor [Tannerella sp.]|jgi:TonB-linked SusC/RagA family outer membrane protein|nr:TonB-dependent receptor [Tannerella sp.]
MKNKLINGKKNAKLRKLVNIMTLSVFFLMTGVWTANALSGDSSEASEAQQSKVLITGTVVDPAGVSVAGANVVEKDVTANGTTTDTDGKFSLNVSPGATLTVSFIGYLTQEVAVGNQTQLTVTLQEDAQALEEVVVVGYGMQRKLDLTGSVSTVNSKELSVRPVTNGASLLQGRVAGLNITQSSGQPGSEGFSINLRGIGSFSNSNPFVLIDGIEGALDKINPQDVESVTVLKDAASAAIYGSRASNGVILITTKKGRHDFREVEVKAEVGFQKATRLPDYIYNSVEYMEMFNKGADHSDFDPSVRYSQSLIDAYRNASPGDPRYPNYNWMDAMFQTSVRQDYQVAARGGGKDNSYYFGVGYMNQDGVVDRHYYNQYSARLNLDFDVNPYIRIGTNNSFIYSSMEEPTSDSQDQIMQYIMMFPPTMGPYLSDGSGRYTARDIPDIWRNRNPQMVLDNEGRNLVKKYNLNTQAFVEIRPFKGLVWKTTGAWVWNQTRKYHSNYIVDGYTFTTNEFYGQFEGNDLGIYHNNEWQSNLVFNSILNYDITLANNHHISAIAGYEQQTMGYETKRIRRENYTTSTTTDINAGSASGQSMSGYTRQWVVQSYFGRLNYDFKGRYLVEGNIRYDGTSKLSPENRWSIFPSASAGWRLSEESFMQSATWLDNLKFRLSAGQLGNQNALSEYPYQETLSYVNIPVQGDLQTGVKSQNLANRNLMWETVTDYTLGLDFSMKQGLFGLALDVYRRTTKGGHATAQIPASVGKNAPQDNYKEMENKGIELMLTHQGKINEFRYDVNFIFDKYWNKVTRIKTNSWSTTGSQVAGRPYQEFYVLEWIGIYQNWNEVNTLPMYEPYRAQTKPGDLIFANTNGDNEITVTPGTGDKVFIPGRHPKFSYSLNFNAAWRNFDLSMFWQGVAGKKLYISGNVIEPFQQGTPPLAKWRNAWDGEGSTNSMPAIYNVANWTSYAPINGQTNTFFLQDASYLRLKNLQIGYSISGNVCKRIGIDRFRVYLSGDNILTFSSFDGEPERTSNGIAVFPQLSTYSIGLNLIF